MCFVTRTRRNVSTKMLTTGREVFFGEDEIIVSKTDLQGKILYANDVFLRVAGYELKDVIGQPHNLIRHPDMPRAVFKLLWETISSGNEIFAYVVNATKNMDYYWVIAHVTPSYGANGEIVGYHSNRRVPERSAVVTITELYEKLLSIERENSDRRRGLQASTQYLLDVLEGSKCSYDEFVFSTL